MGKADVKDEWFGGIQPTGGVGGIPNARVFVLGFSIIPHRYFMIRSSPKVPGLVMTVSFLLRESSGYEGSVLGQIRLLRKRMASM